MPRLLVITGAPASGKTTLARELACRYGAALIAKDTIKEPLLDVLGAPDRAASRTLSDASFAVMFALARAQLATGSSVLLEGNFRATEHPAALRVLTAAPAVRCAQVLCVLEEGARRERLASRAHDPARHAGHRDAELAYASAAAENTWLDLPGERFVHDGGGAAPGTWLATLDRWWREP
jgi:predicted kinase